MLRAILFMIQAAEAKLGRQVAPSDSLEVLFLVSLFVVKF